MDHQDKKCLLREKLKVERVTPQRVLIYDIVKDIKKHMHVEEIYELARKKYPKINLATVYRTLKEFKKAGVVDELHLEQDHHHYESADKNAHHHLICEKCSHVLDFQSDYIDKLEKKIAKQHGFKISKVHVQISGMCGKCG